MKPKLSASQLAPLAAWLVAALVAIGVVAVLEYRNGVAELSEWSRETETLLAEKLAQHDAHMTALAAVIRMAPEEPSAGVQGLAEAVTAFYPRITEIATIRRDGAAAHVLRYGSAEGPIAAADLPAGDLPPLQKPGETAIHALRDSRAYEIYKLVVPGRLLRLRIDAGGLLSNEQLPEAHALGLFLGDAPLFARTAEGAPLFIARRTLAIGNVSQPLRLELERGFGFGELFPARVLLPLLLALAAIVWLGAQYRKTTAERRRQELRATLLEQEARLAHAGRVNALGEMASGIAHELAQPIAALLSQSQAARRALALNRNDVLEQAIEANIGQAKRAGDILGRMRAYISGGEAQMESMTLGDAIQGALRLVEADLAQRGIALDVAIADEPCTVNIDVISFQQVIHNLIRNAAEALAGRPEPRIALRAGPEGAEAVITIADNGPGIDAAALDRIFEPFFTTKPDGLGLGLPLCARLIEKMDGTLEARNEGGASFTIQLPRGENR